MTLSPFKSVLQEKVIVFNCSDFCFLSISNDLMVRRKAYFQLFFKECVAAQQKLFQIRQDNEHSVLLLLAHV